MKKSIFVTVLFSILVGSFFTVSCSKQEDTILMARQNPNSLTYEGMGVDYVNSLIDTYAKILSKALDNDELRVVIKEKAERMFDGDYDILCTELQVVPLESTGETVFDLLVASYNEIFEEGSGDEFLEEVNKSLPNLQVAVPVYIEEWDPMSFRPFVIPLAVDFVDGSDIMVDGYDENLATIQVSSKEEPDFPMIVVGISERVDRNGQFIMGGDITSGTIERLVLPSPSHLICEYTTAANAVRLRWPAVTDATGYNIYQTDDMGYDVLIGTTSSSVNIFNSTGLNTAQTYQYMVRAFNDDGYSVYSNVAEITVTNRVSGSPLRLKTIQFSKNGLKRVECWLRGGPEVRLRIIKSSINGDTSDIKYTSPCFEPSRDEAILPFTCNHVLLTSWAQSRYNDVLEFEWREEDNFFPVNTQVRASYTIDTMRTFLGMINASASTEFKVSYNSDIASQKVCFWDPKEHQYGSMAAGFTFNVDANLY